MIDANANKKAKDLEKSNGGPQVPDSPVNLRLSQ